VSIASRSAGRPTAHGCAAPHDAHLRDATGLSGDSAVRNREPLR
jgi:hypothetical protein